MIHWCDARPTVSRLSHRVEALKRVERSLLNCKRLGDPELLQARCFTSLHVPYVFSQDAIGKRVGCASLDTLIGRVVGDRVPRIDEAR